MLERAEIKQQKEMSTFDKLEDLLYKIIYYFSSLLMIGMVAVIFSQVVARYVFHNSLSWSEEVGRYLFVWMTFLGTALGVRKRAHVSLDSLIKQLPTPIYKAIVVLSYLAMIIFTCVLAYDSLEMLKLGTHQVSAAMQMPMKYVYYVLPIGSVLTIFYLARNLIVDIWRGGESQ